MASTPCTERVPRGGILFLDVLSNAPGDAIPESYGRNITNLSDRDYSIPVYYCSVETPRHRLGNVLPSDIILSHSYVHKW